jgi:hypothetical protein
MKRIFLFILFSAIIMVFGGLEPGAWAKNPVASSGQASPAGTAVTNSSGVPAPVSVPTPPTAVSGPGSLYRTQRPVCPDGLLGPQSTHQTGLVGVLVSLKDRPSLRMVIRKKVLDRYCVHLFGLTLDRITREADREFERKFRASRDPQSLDYNPGRTNFLLAVRVPENFAVPVMDLRFQVSKSKLNIKLFQKYQDKEYLLLDSPVALGAGGFPTPLGQFYIQRIVNLPWWFPPAWAGQRHPSRPGKDNPYGLWMGELSRAAAPGGYAFNVFGDSGIRVHSTNNPRSIGRFASHGCIRLHPEVAEELFPALLHYRPHLEGRTNVRGTVHPLQTSIPIVISAQ